MATEHCPICGKTVPFDTTVHMLINPKHQEGVVDHYVCRACYEEHVEPLFEGDDDGSGPAAGDPSVAEQ